ncbi:MAG TPA: hypothetical protein VK616_02980 [Flavitalea sp.]|nr:hypothetical protein [Flavitalea sp.]
MRLIKLGIISLIVFSIIIFVFSLFIPSHVRISRAINIAVPKSTLSVYIADIRNWRDWNAIVNEQDSSTGKFEKISYTGNKLSIKLLSSTVDSVRTIWKQGDSDPVISGFNLVQSLSDTTVAQWYFDFRLNWYPWEKFGSIIFDQQLGPSMEKSLNNLKSTLENQPH